MRSAQEFPREWLKHILLVGNTPTFSSQHDARFSYSLYVPDEHYMPTPTSPKLPLVVVIHGTLRDHLGAKNALRSLADNPSTACAVLAPLFPAGITGSEDLSSYKEIVVPSKRKGTDADLAETIRYDQILLAMVDEVAARYPGIETSKFLMSGYSGGGQFTHRFFYLHPDRLVAASVGAPGNITLFADREAYFAARDLHAFNWEGLAAADGSHSSYADVTLQILVGSQDIDTRQFAVARKVEGDGIDTRTRVEKAAELCEDWKAHGLDVRLDTVPGAAHNWADFTVALKGFFGPALKALH